MTVEELITKLSCLSSGASVVDEMNLPISDVVYVPAENDIPHLVALA